MKSHNHLHLVEEDKVEEAMEEDEAVIIVEVVVAKD